MMPRWGDVADAVDRVIKHQPHPTDMSVLDEAAKDPETMASIHDLYVELRPGRQGLDGNANPAIEKLRQVLWKEARPGMPSTVRRVKLPGQLAVTWNRTALGWAVPRQTSDGAGGLSESAYQVVAQCMARLDELGDPWTGALHPVEPQRAVQGHTDPDWQLVELREVRELYETLILHDVGYWIVALQHSVGYIKHKEQKQEIESLIKALNRAFDMLQRDLLADLENDRLNPSTGIQEDVQPKNVETSTAQERKNPPLGEHPLRAQQGPGSANITADVPPDLAHMQSQDTAGTSLDTQHADDRDDADRADPEDMTGRPSANSYLRYRRLCEPCKIARMKCSRDKPSCTQCTEARTHCFYALEKPAGAQQSDESIPVRQSDGSNEYPHRVQEMVNAIRGLRLHPTGHHRGLPFRHDLRLHSLLRHEVVGQAGLLKDTSVLKQFVGDTNLLPDMWWRWLTEPNVEVVHDQTTAPRYVPGPHYMTSTGVRTFGEGSTTKPSCEICRKRGQTCDRRIPCSRCAAVSPEDCLYLPQATIRCNQCVEGVRICDSAFPICGCCATASQACSYLDGKAARAPREGDGAFPSGLPAARGIQVRDSTQPAREAQTATEAQTAIDHAASPGDDEPTIVASKQLTSEQKLQFREMLRCDSLSIEDPQSPAEDDDIDRYIASAERYNRDIESWRNSESVDKRLALLAAFELLRAAASPLAQRLRLAQLLESLFMEEVQHIPKGVQEFIRHASATVGQTRPDVEMTVEGAASEAASTSEASLSGNRLEVRGGTSQTAKQVQGNGNAD